MVIERGKLRGRWEVSFSRGMNQQMFSREEVERGKVVEKNVPELPEVQRRERGHRWIEAIEELTVRVPR